MRREEGKGREGKGREGKGREGKGRGSLNAPVRAVKLVSLAGSGR